MRRGLTNEIQLGVSYRQAGDFRQNSALSNQIAYPRDRRAQEYRPYSALSVSIWECRTETGLPGWGTRIRT